DRIGESRTAPRLRASARLVRIQAANEGGTMGSFQEWFRAAPPVRTRESVFAVGRRVYVACVGERLAHVALTDDAGADARTVLADGTEVEILAWRPRGSRGTRYRVRATRDGREGWLAVDNLRGTPSGVSAPVAPPSGSHGSGAVARDGIRGCRASVRPGCGLTKMGSREMDEGGAGSSQVCR